GARVEIQLQETGVLNRFGLDALDTVDVEEVVLVVVRDVPLHLRRAHPAVRLRDVNHRQIQVGKNVDPHTADRKDSGQRDRDHGDRHGDRTTERGAYQPHNKLAKVVSADSGRG